MKFDVNVKDNISKEIAAKLKELDAVPREAIKEFISLTPIDKGNARNHTKLQGHVINADYQYAKRLNEGWSKQAPKGMIDPFFQWYEKRIKEIVEK